MGKNCTAYDRTAGIQLWGECYSIEQSSNLYLFKNKLTAEISAKIENL